MSRRDKQIISLLGELPLKRAYYHCPSCGHGHVPLDQEVGLGGVASHARRDRSDLPGRRADQLRQASETTLRKRCAACGLSESTVERTTESAGERLAGVAGGGRDVRQAAGRPSLGSGSAMPAAARVAYVGLDATGVRQQGEKGAQSRRSDGLCGPDLQSARGLVDARAAAGLDAASSPVFSGFLRAGRRWAWNCVGRPRRSAGTTPSNKSRCPMAALVWKSSSARTFRWPWSSWTSGTPKSIWWNWPKPCSVKAATRERRGSTSAVTN